jgi:hypothetical protein
MSSIDRTDLIYPKQRVYQKQLQTRASATYSQFIANREPGAIAAGLRATVDAVLVFRLINRDAFLVVPS